VIAHVPARRTDAALERYIGLMSGTSVDGIDAALCAFTVNGTWHGVLGHVHLPFEPDLRAELEALQVNGQNELHRAALAGNALARAYANACRHLLEETDCPVGEVTAIGAHGQTVRHQPGLHDGTGYTVQLNQPALLAELTGLPVVADLRSRDVAAGGQGAPLVPPFHRVVFGRSDATVAVVNIGGISNLTVLAPHQPTRGFDCGPGNTLLDAWCQRHLGQAYDADGAWSRSGQVHGGLLATLLADPYLAATPPKSTGRDQYNPAWLCAALAPHPGLAAVDIQSTLCEFTSKVVADALLNHGDGACELLVCGGGAYNLDLMDRLQARLASIPVRNSRSGGLPPLQVEAAAFAWLARMCWHRQAAGEPAVTGAVGPRVLGSIYPA
jgi:anhydro-N-acetylmuramic acid kinase